MEKKTTKKTQGITNTSLLENVPVSGVLGDGLKYVGDLKTYKTMLFTVARAILNGFEDSMWTIGNTMGLGYFNRRKKVGVTLINPKPYAINMSFFNPKGILFGYIDRKAIKFYMDKKGWILNAAGSLTSMYIAGMKLDDANEKIYAIPEEAKENGYSVKEYQTIVKKAFVEREREEQLPIYIKHDVEVNKISKEEATKKWETLLTKREKSNSDITKYEKAIAQYNAEIEG